MAEPWERETMRWQIEELQRAVIAFCRAFAESLGAYWLVDRLQRAFQRLTGRT